MLRVIAGRLGLLLVAAGFMQGQANQREPCSVCPFPNNLFGPLVGAQARHIKTRPLPSLLRISAREEPWPFSLTVDRNGSICQARLLRGVADAFTAELSQSIKKWTFTPFQIDGVAKCFTTNIFIYVREQKGKKVLLIPGLDN